MKIKFVKIIMLTVAFQSSFALTDAGSIRERPLIGVQGGLNFETATTPAQVSTSSRTGFTVGLTLDMPLNNVVSIQPEINYSRRSISMANIAGAEANVYYHSLEHPAFLKVSLGERIHPYIFMGPMGTWNFSKEFEVGDQSSSTSFEFNPKTIDLSVVGGVGLQISSFFITARYSLGILDISETSGEWRSRGFKFLAGLQF